MEKKYADAIAALAEVILEQRNDAKMKDWEIANLKATIEKTEKEKLQREVEQNDK